MSILCHGIVTLLFVCLALTSHVQAQNLTTKTDQSVQSAELLAISVVGEAESVRLVLEINGAPNIDSFLTQDDYRFVIDLDNTQIKVPGNKARGQSGFLSRIQFGQVHTTGLRMVLASDTPFVLERHFSRPNRLSKTTFAVFDFRIGDENIYQAALEDQARALRLKAETELKRRAEEAARAAQLKQENRKWRVVIDPGHGGKDAGAKTKTGRLEKNIVLEFSQKLAEALRGSGLVDVVLTRNDDIFVPLAERVNIGKNARADLFISIHADSLPTDRRVRGTAIYTISEDASDALAAKLVEQQNKVDAIKSYELKAVPNEVVDALFDLTRQRTSNLSAVFARHVRNELKGKIRFFKFPIQRGAFTVLRVPEIPSALIELGFLSNNTDAKQLTSQPWRERVALEMAAAIVSYFKNPVISSNRR